MVNVHVKLKLGTGKIPLLLTLLVNTSELQRRGNIYSTCTQRMLCSSANPESAIVLCRSSSSYPEHTQWGCVLCPSPDAEPKAMTITANIDVMDLFIITVCVCVCVCACVCVGMCIHVSNCLLHGGEQCYRYQHTD